jgi:hypothetical protein
VTAAEGRQEARRRRLRDSRRQGYGGDRAAGRRRRLWYRTWGHQGVPRVSATGVLPREVTPNNVIP